MTEPDAAPGPPAASPLTTALRGIRRARGLRARDLAQAMGLPLRTYLHFEAAIAAPSPERLRAFARVTDSDFAALLLCAGGLDSRLAIACADNKAITIVLGAMEDLRESLSTAFSTLTPAQLIRECDRSRRRLEKDAFALSRSRLRAGPDAATGPLTARQLECLRWAQAGKSSTDIGTILGISPRTAETHLAEACARLGVRTRIQAILAAINLGLLSPQAP